MYFSSPISNSQFLASAFGLVDHRCQDGHEFIRFAFQWQRKRRFNTAFFTEQFKPKLAFVGFLEGAA